MASMSFPPEWESPDWRPGACLFVAVLLAGCTTPDIEPSGQALSMMSVNRSGLAPRQGAALSHYGSTSTRETSPASQTGAEVVLASAAPLVVPDSLVSASEPANHKTPAIGTDRPATALAASGKIPEAEGITAAVPLTLSSALNQSLVSNPDLVTLRGQLNINQAMVGVSQTYPWNPFVQTQFLPSGQPFVANAPGMPASGTGYASYYVWVMQRFELAHQRRHRTDSAIATMTQVQWNIFHGELLNVAQTTRLYFAALYQKEICQLAQETAELNERLLEVVERRFKANLARASEVTTAKVAARQSRHQAELAETVYQAALLALRQQLNLPMGAPVTIQEHLADIQWLPLTSDHGKPEESLLAAELVEGRPDVMAAKSGVRVSQANLSLARAARVPDVQTGPIYETGTDTTRYIGFRFQMDLPVWNTGKPLVRQRQAEMNQQQLTADQLKVRAALEAQFAIDQYQRVRELSQKMTPARPGAMPAELKEITTLFEAGQADVLAVLTTQNNLLQERRIGLDLLNQLGQSAAAVIQATGLSPARVIRLPDGGCETTFAPEPSGPTQP